MPNGPPPSAAGPSHYQNPPQPHTAYWQNAWSYPYQPQPFPVYGYPQYTPYANPPTPVAANSAPVSQPEPVPKSSTPPPFHQHWDAALKAFLTRLGLTQALRGFECDILVMNAEWERSEVPLALDAFVGDIAKLSKVECHDAPPEPKPLERTLDERKLDYIHLANGAAPRSQTSLTKSISQFLAQNRARNDASNRVEFLRGTGSDQGTCARTDARTVDRELQMKYDIAKNEEGPLRRTMKADVDVAAVGNGGQERAKRRRVDDGGETEKEEMTSARYPAIAERLESVEAHLAVRYVPGQPHSLLTRLKYLEDHITQLEKEYPPWAALHFNQPRRGWPPPPRPTPIIVPSHLTSTAPALPPLASNASPVLSPASEAKPTRKATSSLHRAVMERLEVQKAMSDLHGSEGGRR